MPIRKLQSTVRPLACALAASLLVSGCAMTPEEEAAMIEEALMADESSTAVWTAVKEGYPDDYNALIEKLRADYSENGTPLETSQRAGEEWLINFQGRVVPTVKNAPADDILEWRSADYEMKVLLEKDDVEQCASVIMGTATFIESESEEVRSAIDARTEAMIRAAAAGRDDPQEYETPPDALFVKLEQGLRKIGLDDRMIDGLVSTEGMNALSSAEKCDIGVSLAEAIEALPEDEAVQLTAYYLGNS